MKKWMYIVLYCICAAALLCLVGYEVLVNQNYDTGFFLKAGVCAVALIGCILRYTVKPIPRSSNRRVKYRTAYAEFLEGAFTDDRKAEKRFLDALDAYNQKMYAASLDILNKLQKQCQRSSDRYAVTVFQALCCHDMNAYQDAVRYYEAALLFRPNSKLASNLGLCYEKMGDYEMATKAYRRATQLDPNNAVPYSNVAQVCMRTGDYASAVKFAQMAYERNQKMVPALNALAVSHYMLGNKSEYEHWYRQAVASGSDPAKLKTYIASLDPSL